MKPPPEPFTLPVVSCPSCGHGIDPHKGWREPCGVGESMEEGIRGIRTCKCVWTPNDIAATQMQRVNDLASGALRAERQALVDLVEELRSDDPEEDQHPVSYYVGQRVVFDAVLAFARGES